MTNEFILLEKELYDIYKNSLNGRGIKKIHPKFFSTLKEKGFLIDKEINELEECIDILNVYTNRNDYYLMTINPTINCNFKCWYCYETHIKESKIKPNIISNIIIFTKKIIENNSKLEKFYLSWFGGEPLLQYKNGILPIIKGIYNLCKEKDIVLYSNMTTNGLLIKDNMINDFKKYNLNHFQITFDGHRERHNEVRYISNNKGSYDKIVENIKKLLKNEVNVTARINCSKKTFNDLYKIADDFKNISNNDKKYLKFGFYKVWQVEEGLEENLDKYITEFRNLGFKVTSVSLGGIKSSCYADKKNQALINYNGDVFKCTARDFTKENREGILNDKGEIEWNERYKKRFDKKYTNKPCLECSIFPICKGGCSQHTLENDKDYCIHGFDEKKKEKVILDNFLARIQ